MLRRAIIAVLGSMLWALLLTQASAQSDGTGERKRVYISVAGAPGDGEQSLASALSKTLQAAGVQPLKAPADNAYEIQGMVRVSAAPGGMENIQITWIVFGPDGSQLGVVSQAREVRKGAFDRKWGAAANAAASTAAEEIMPLLER